MYVKPLSSTESCIIEEDVDYPSSTILEWYGVTQQVTFFYPFQMH